MISEELPAQHISETESIVAHLDKSHLCIHTYPDDAPQNDIAIFRADIELSTCGIISPLKVLNHVIEAFDADVIDIDYRVRGMTRDKHGKKIYNIDTFDDFNSFLSAEIAQSYNINEHHFRKQNLFNAKLSKNNITINDFLFDKNTEEFSDSLRQSIFTRLAKEVKQLFTNSA
jgi:S-adenosylmethionine decarboxylase